METLRKDRPEVPSLRAAIPAFPLVDWETEGANSAPRSDLKKLYGDKPQWTTIQALFDQPVSCSDPYPADVL